MRLNPIHKTYKIQLAEAHNLMANYQEAVDALPCIAKVT
jgi:hypothetical protein